MIPEEDYPPVDAAFPALSVLKPFYGQGLFPYLPFDAYPSWVDDFEINQKMMEGFDDLIRDMMMAGYRLREIHFALQGVAPGEEPIWLTTALSDRSVTVGTVNGLDYPVVGTNAAVHLCFQPYASADGITHHVDLNPAPTDTPATMWRFGPSDIAGEFMISIWKVNATGTNTDKLDDLTTAAGQVRGFIAGRLGPVIGGTENAGLFWLFNPANWFSGSQAPPSYDHLTVQFYGWAQEVWDSVNASAQDRLGFLYRQLFAATSFEKELAVVDDLERTKGHFAGLAVSRSLPASEGSKSPLGEAFWQNSYFDLLCMLAQRERITPSLLKLTGLVGFWSPPEPAGEAIWPTALTVTNNRIMAIRLLLFDEPAIDLIQRVNPDDFEDTPDLLSNVAWEYLGKQPDGRHGIGITAGRGVEIVKKSSGSWNFDIELHLAQTQSEIRLPMSRPAELDPYQLDANGDIITDAATSDPNLPTNVDDISATAGQRLEYDMIRAPQTHECVDIDVDEFPNLGPGFPTLVVTRLDNSGVRFDWFRAGVPQTEGNKAPADYTMTISPTTPHAGDFGFCWSLDYAKLNRRQLNQDSVLEGISTQILESLKASLMGPIYYQLYQSLTGRTVFNNFDFATGAFAIGYMRIWYSGDVDIEVSRSMESDEDFRVELVKVHDVMRLPQQGLNLPARHAQIEEVMDIPFFVLIAAAIAVWIENQPTYDETIPPTPADEPQSILPHWHTINMPDNLLTNGDFDRDKAEHVYIAEPFILQLYGPSLPAACTWPDVRLFRNDPRNSIILPSPSTGEPPYLIEPATVTINPSTDWLIVQTTIDITIGLIPIVGDYADGAEFFLAAATGKDKWGQPVPWWGVVLMGVGTAVPFVSSGVVRKLSNEAVAAGAGLSTAFTAVMVDAVTSPDDQTGGSSATALGRAFMAFVEEGPTAVRARLLGEAITDPGAAYKNMTKAEKRGFIRGLLQLDQFADIYAGAGRALMTAALREGLKFEDLLNAVGEFRIPALETAYKAWAKGRLAPGHGRRMFIQTRIYSSGFWRIIGETFSLVPPAVRRIRGNPQPNANFPHLIDLVIGSFPAVSRAEIIARLSDPDPLIAALKLMSQRMDLPIWRSQIYINKYTYAAKTFLEHISQDAALMEKLLGSSTKIQSPEDAILVIFHLMELVSDSHMNVANRIGGAAFSLDDFIALGRRVKEVPPDPDDVAEFQIMIDAMADLMNKGMGRSANWHGYAFEYRLSVILSGLVKLPGIVAVRLQARIGGKAGPDFIVVTAQGFAIIQAKAYMALKHLVGIRPSQANEVQAITDLARLFEKNGLLDGMTEVFNGKYICVLDDDWLTGNGQLAFDTLFEVLGNSVTIPISALAPPRLDADTFAKVTSGATTSGSNLVFTNLDSWKAAAQHLDASYIETLFGQARTALGGRITQLLGTMNDVDTLRTMLTAGDALADRNAATFVALLNNKTGVNVTEDMLKAPGGAQLIFDKLGLRNGWLDTLGNPGGVPEIKVVGQAGLEAMEVADFSRTVTP